MSSKKTATPPPAPKPPKLDLEAATAEHTAAMAELDEARGALQLHRDRVRMLELGAQATKARLTMAEIAAGMRPAAVERVTRKG